MRFVAICLLILAVMFVGHTVYDRSRIDHILTQAESALPLYPQQAYTTLQTAYQYNDTVALGKVSQARREFFRAVEQKVLAQFNTPPATAESFISAGQGLTVLQDLEKLYALDSRTARTAIIQAARDAAPGVRDKGTLQAWQRMLELIKNVKNAGQFPPGVFEDYDRWMAQQLAVPVRPLGLRDASVAASTFLNSALNTLGLTSTGASGPFVVTAPLPLADQRLIDAEHLFTQALHALDGFPTLFNERQLPPELFELRARIRYNMAAIKMAHIQERGSSVLQTQASDYIAELVISPGAGTVPTPSEMMAAFVQSAQADLQEALEKFPQAPTLAQPLRDAFAALTVWSEGLLDSAFGRGNPQNRQQALQYAANVTGPAAAIIQAMQANQRVMLIVYNP